MTKKFDTDIVKTTVFRSVDDAGKAIVASIRRKKNKTKQDLDTLKNWDRAQNGGRQTQFRYNADGTRIPHSDPGRRPHLPASVVRSVWKDHRDNQLANWQALGLPRRPGPGEAFVRNRADEWVPVQQGTTRNRPWDMGHTSGSEFRNTHADYLDALDDPDIDNQEALDNFLAEFRDPERYTVQDRIRNRSHDDEA